jgi:hypothetical protein
MIERALPTFTFRICQSFKKTSLSIAIAIYSAIFMEEAMIGWGGLNSAIASIKSSDVND